MKEHREELPRLKFRALADELLKDAESLVSQWLNGGEREGHEWKCGSLSGGKGRSCSVRLEGDKAGYWSDFNTEESGKDLLGLYAAINNLTMVQATLQLARDLGLEDVAGVVKTASGAAVKPPAHPRPAPPPKAKPEKEGWTSVWPVPSIAPRPTFVHFERQPADLENTAEYRDGENLLGYVLRYRTSKGGKDTLPYTFAKSDRDGTLAWKWRTWEEPRPLYFPGGTRPGERTVIMVEGEVKAQVLQAQLDACAPGIYCVVSWPGGCKVWAKACWTWLAGSTVLLWPDCDAHRERLSRAEQAAVKADPEARAKLEAGKPLLPADKQPGMKAMLGIGALLRDEHGCRVQLLPIPQPGEKPSGWDCKDAISVDGWTGADVLAFFGRAQPLPSMQTDAEAPANAGPAAAGGGGKKPPKPLSPVGTDGGRSMPPLDDDDKVDDQDWLWPFFDRKKNRWDLRRSLVVAALQNDPKLKGCVAFNEMTKGAQVRKAWPWEHAQAGDLDADSSLLLGLYLNNTYGVGDISVQNIKDGIATVAFTERFHPVREWLDELVWDKVPRLDKWLMHVLDETPETLSKPMAEYLTLVGRYWLLGMVWRVMEPGCKFDYCPVLEGKGGLRKSTMVEILAVRPEWYSDTKFDLSRGKEAYEQVRGKWLYELGELSSLSRADVNDVKAFISSKIDDYRVAYGERAQSFPRQCVLAGSTNDKKYLRDRTGNRRFWPIPVRHVMKTEWLERMRGQLMAEAYALYLQGGVRFTPSQEEEARLFVPMQESRLQESAVDAELFKLLTRQPSASAQFIHCDADRVPVNSLIKGLGVDIGKVSSVLKGQVEAWLESNGWEFKGRQRVNGALESSVYFRPKNWPPELDATAADWTRQDDVKAEPEADGSVTYEAPPLPSGMGADGVPVWDGDDESF